MKPVYTALQYLLPFFFTLIISAKSDAQCPSGHPNGSVAFDTTIATPAGFTTRQVKFPQFDPSMAMLTCVRLCISITAVVDTMDIENNSASSQTADVIYTRGDNITGPGLGTPLTNNFTYMYGTYNLGASNGVPGSGPDFVAVSKDTVMNAVTVCRTISDSATISQFYGLDSVAYTYNITALVSPIITGGDYNFRIGTSAFVNFRFEYCTCPATALPLNVRAFNISKITDTRAELKWTGFDDPFANYHYEVEVSRNSRNFTSIGVVEKNTEGTNPYRFIYDVPNGEQGVYYFRIKQVYSNGYVRYSNIKQVTLQSSASTKFSVYPNPSSGIVGIKFDTSVEGKFNVQIFNTQGQVVMQKDIVAAGEAPVQVGNLSSGVYWLRLTDKKTQSVSVAQLLIK